MWEFLARIGFAIVLMGFSLGIQQPSLDVSLKISALTVAYAFLAFVLDRRKLGNPGMSGLFAGLDCLALAAALAYGNQLHNLGALVVAPIVYAVTKRGSNPLAMGPIGAAAVISAEGLVSNSMLPSPIVLVQGGLVLVVSMLANQPRVVVRPQTIQQMIAELAQSEQSEKQVETSTQALIELREKYRRLNTTFRELERKSRVTRIASKLLLTRKKYAGNLDAIADQLCELLELKGVVIYTTNQVGDRMIVSATGGRSARNCDGVSFPVNGREAAAQLKQRASEAYATVSSSGLLPSQNVLLRSHGSVIGVMTLITDSAEKLEDLVSKSEEIADVIGYIVSDERERRCLVRRAHEAELMYQIACNLDGALTEADLGRRCAQALEDVLTADHIGIWMLDEDRLIAVGRSGKPAPLMDSYSNGGGIQKWLEHGSPQVLAYSVADATVFDSRTGVRYRIGSFIAMPIRVGDEVIGLLTAGASGDGAFHSDDAITLSNVAAELAHAFFSTRERSKLAPQTHAHGMLSVPEFQQEVTQLKSAAACLVYIEPDIEETEPNESAVTMQQMTRELTYLARRHAPHNAKLCRKPDGGVVVLLPELEYSEAERWANQISSISNARHVESSTGSGPISLVSKVRVADLNARPEKKVA
ncbi:MAG: GAF domain-containing protein [Fimbriimonadales bacterium]